MLFGGDEEMMGGSVDPQAYLIHFARNFGVRDSSAMLFRQVWRSETKGNIASQLESSGR